jgi:phosphate transport system permease protein
LNVFIKDIFNLHHGNTWLSGSLILAIMALPTIVSVCEDAIRAVPNYYREASYAMGATRWQTIYRVVIPSGMSGITAALILGIGRALGETMAMLLIIGNSKMFPEPITNMLDSVAVITSTIAAGWGPTEQGSLEQRSYLALAILLFLMTLVINTIANLILSKIQRKFSGEKPKERFSKLKEFNFYECFQNYKQLISTLLISGLIAIIPIDLMSRVIGVSICIGLSLMIFIRKKTPQNYKKLITYIIILSIIGWILSTWVGIFLSITLCVLFIGTGLIFRKLFTVAQQKLWFSIIYLCSSLAVFAVGILIFYIVVRGFPVLLEPDFLIGYPSHNGREGGIFPAIVGTLQLTLGSILFALPLGVCAGIYLSEYARNNKITKFIRANIDNLNGTPSIVFALFGFVFFILFFGLGRSLLVGILTLGLMILPTIIRTTEEAIKAIPQSFREGSLALGSSKWKSISKIVLPAAVPGIVTGAVLGMGRSAGETAPIMFTAVRSSARWITFSLFEPVMALTYHLYRLNTEVLGAVDKAAGTALTLLILVLLLYGFAFIVRSKYEKRKQW